MDFEEYCKKKKIDPEKFQGKDRLKWKELKVIFEQVSPESFTQQKKFLINELRRLYPFKETIAKPEEKPGPAVSGPTPSVPKKPAIKIAPKIKKTE